MDELAPKPSGETAETEAALTVDQLPEQLGFIETEELAALREELTQAVAEGNWDHIRGVKRRYLEQGERIVEQLQGEDFVKGQIGLIVATGLVMRDGGALENYGGELENARQYAWNMEYNDVAAVLEAAMEEVNRTPPTLYPPHYKAPPEEFDEGYLAELKQLAAKYEAESQPLQTEMQGNTLLVDGRLMTTSDTPADLWRALVDGQEGILRGLEEYRGHLQAQDPGKTVLRQIPFSVLHLGYHPKDFLSPSGIERQERFEQLLTDAEDLKPELRPFWQAVEASGFMPEIRLLKSKDRWDRLNLWARLPITDQDEIRSDDRSGPAAAH